MWDKKICICKNCSTNQKAYWGASVKPCENCGKLFTELNLTVLEFKNIFMRYKNIDLFYEMDKLKKENPIDFQIKYNELENSYSSKPSSKSNTPKCPTCGSTNIKKISGGKRWLTTGIFGLASSDVGKNMQCNSCGAKW